MPWRQFWLLCTLIITFFIYFLQPTKSKEEDIITFEVDEEMLVGGGVTYVVALLPVDAKNQALPKAVTRQKYMCGKYFFSIHYGDKKYVGFYALFPNEDNTSLIRLPMLFPTDSYRVIPPHHTMPASPEVEFNNGIVIVHTNKSDFNQLTCLANRIII